MNPHVNVVGVWTLTAEIYIVKLAEALAPSSLQRSSERCVLCRWRFIFTRYECGKNSRGSRVKLSERGGEKTLLHINIHNVLEEDRPEPNRLFPSNPSLYYFGLRIPITTPKRIQIIIVVHLNLWPIVSLFTQIMDKNWKCPQGGRQI